MDEGENHIGRIEKRRYLTSKPAFSLIYYQCRDANESRLIVNLINSAYDCPIGGEHQN